MLPRPVLQAEEHPLEKGIYTFPTPVVLGLQNQVMKWIRRRVTGGMIYGPQRFGKTKAVEYICNELVSQHGENYPVFSIPMEKLRDGSQFFMHFLYHAQHQLHEKATETMLRNRLNNFLIARAMQDRTRRVILFIDEAQLLTRVQSQALVDLQNALKAQDVYASFILVGQPELRHMANAYLVSENLQFVGRFMANRVEFCGLQNVNELRICLGIYDELATYPENSEWTFTRYYAPEAYLAGWRLRHHAQAIWDAFAEIRHSVRLPVRGDLPMEWLTIAIRILMTEMVGTEGNFKGFSYNQIKEAVLESNYANACRYALRPQEDPKS